MKKRWISLFVENEIGVLARISGLFSGKSYNLDSLSVGTSQDETMSRMTISFTSDDQTFEQIKKQLNRSVEVIKVLDLTDAAIHMKELMFIKIKGCFEHEIVEVLRICTVFEIRAIDYNTRDVVLESIQPESRNYDLITLLGKRFPDRMEVVRGGSVAIEAVGIGDRQP